jgi:hypothetical protein
MNKPIHWRKRKRVHAMMWAHLVFHARKLPVADRDAKCWLYLLEWASLGGTPDEVIS